MWRSHGWTETAGLKKVEDAERGKTNPAKILSTPGLKSWLVKFDRDDVINNDRLRGLCLSRVHLRHWQFQ
jgi:hypothetical protein